MRMDMDKDNRDREIIYSIEVKYAGSCVINYFDNGVSFYP